ncbi:phosphatidylglycerophosphatase B [Vibrio variabilis]|uniref:Phosphatidylglycerophosphatase B n=1 Tax=Vibrio variabilis TaxID=990271 RepID=A0ABQ0JRL3_9VIBR|nr:phosphatidylglycerophosphatase B [Vibrio variabilis]
MLGQIAILLVLSFTTKTFLKQWTESPRPYTDVFVEETIIDAQADFYALTTDEKNEVISMVTDTVSEWRTKHWLERPIIPSPLGTRSLLLFAYFSLPVYSQAINTNCSLHLFVFGR